MHKKLTEYQEKMISYLYRTNQSSVSELAKDFSVSPRTITRTLKDQGIPLLRESKLTEGQRILKLLKEYGVSVSRLRLLLRQDKMNRPVLPILTTAQMLLPLDTGEKQE
jgi:predicted DNA-binding transcriptional regulator YafY